MTLFFSQRAKGKLYFYLFLFVYFYLFFIFYFLFFVFILFFIFIFYFIFLIYLFFIYFKRYIIHPNSSFETQLTKWGSRRKKETVEFQCVCGACTVAVTLSFSKEIPKNASSEFTTQNDLIQMNKILENPLESLDFGFTQGVINKDQESSSKFYSSDRGEWRVFRCKSCFFIVFAQNLDSKSSLPKYAVLTNFPVIKERLDQIDKLLEINVEKNNKEKDDFSFVKKASELINDLSSNSYKKKPENPK